MRHAARGVVGVFGAIEGDTTGGQGEVQWGSSTNGGRGRIHLKKKQDADAGHSDADHW